MKALTIFYSRTGTTKRVAEALSKALSCDVEEILDTKNRSGPLGYIASGRDAMRKRLTEIHPVKSDPSHYDIVLIGTPVWAGTMSTPVRTYISQNREHFKRIAFFCTYGGTGADRTLKTMKELCGKEEVASVAITTKETRSKEYEEKINQFANAIRSSTSNL